MKISFGERFWSKVDIAGPSDCWVWLAGQNKDGYGKFSVGPARWDFAHRLAWLLEGSGWIPDGWCVCHKCDNPSCCNPRHLFPGTHRMNAVDKVRKGRHRTRRQ